MRDADTIALAHGRFQPLHIGHLTYLLEARKRRRRLVVGIANPDPSLTAPHPTNPHRSLASSNPFTYWERLCMVEESLTDLGMPLSDFSVVPFPINKPELLSHYVPGDALHCLTILDDWGRAKEAALRSLGMAVEVLYATSRDPRHVSGSEIRRRIVAREDWESLVPEGTRRTIERIGIDAIRQRIAKLDKDTK